MRALVLTVKHGGRDAVGELFLCLHFLPSLVALATKLWYTGLDFGKHR